MEMHNLAIGDTSSAVNQLPSGGKPDFDHTCAPVLGNFLDIPGDTTMWQSEQLPLAVPPEGELLHPASSISDQPSPVTFTDQTGLTQNDLQGSDNNGMGNCMRVKVPEGLFETLKPQKHIRDEYEAIPEKKRYLILE